MLSEAVALYHELLADDELARTSLRMLDEGLERAKLIFGGTGSASKVGNSWDLELVPNARSGVSIAFDGPLSPNSNGQLTTTGQVTIVLDATHSQTYLIKAVAREENGQLIGEFYAVSSRGRIIYQGSKVAFYGTFHTTVAMSTNGFLDFAPSAASDVPNNQCPLPDPVVPNTIIAVLWDDLLLANAPDPARGGYQQAFATCPYPQGGAGSCVIFQWHRADHLTGSTDAFSLQAALYEDGDILMKFTAGNLEEGINSTTGIESSIGLGVTDACDVASSVTADSAVLFLAPPFVGATVGEAEPNDATATATALPAGTCGAGGIAGAGDADVWSIAATGTLLYALVDTRFAAPSPTSALRVLAPDGADLGGDTDSGPAGGSAVAGVPIPATGALARVTEAGENAALAPYALTVLAVAAEDRGVEVVEHCNRCHHAGRLALDRAIGVCGEEVRHERDVRRIVLGELLTCRVDADASQPRNLVGLECRAVVATDIDDDVASVGLYQPLQIGAFLGQMADHRLVQTRAVAIVLAIHL